MTTKEETFEVRLERMEHRTNYMLQLVDELEAVETEGFWKSLFTHKEKR